MKIASSSLLSLLNTNLGSDVELMMARLYTLTLVGGGVFRWTDYETDLTLALPVPVNGSYTDGAGTLTAGTYYYRVTALFGPANESLPSAQTPAVIATTEGINVNWSAVSGATGYRIYGRTSGAELYLGAVGPGVLTWLDTGAITPSGAMPSAAPTFSSSGPAITVGKSRQVNGVELCDMELGLYGGTAPGGGAGYSLPGYTSLSLAALQGAFDNATMQVDKLFMASPGDVSQQPLCWFVGLVSEAAPKSSGVELTLKGSTELLANLQWPKRTLMPQCPYSLYDANCTVVKAPVTVSVQSGATTTSVTVSGLAHGAYTLGTIKFADGESRQIIAMASSGSNDVLTLNMPLNTVPSAGTNNATVLLGCNKSTTTLGTDSGNCTTLGGRFGGFPFVPRPESIR